MGLGSHNLDTSALLTKHEKEAIQIVSLVVACISVISCLVTLYWFAIMARNFRRTLVLLLIISDMFKSLWYLVFPAVSLGIHGVSSSATFCQVGGFFLQAGIESCGAYQV